MLRVALEHPNYVVSEGKHYGFNWIIARNPLGLMSGYIRVLFGHPWFEKKFYDIGISELDFGERGMPYFNLDNGYWIGFTVGNEPYFYGKEDVKQKYVQNRCRAICQEALIATIERRMPIENIELLEPILHSIREKYPDIGDGVFDCPFCKKKNMLFYFDYKIECYVVISCITVTCVHVNWSYSSIESLNNQDELWRNI